MRSVTQKRFMARVFNSGNSRVGYRLERLWLTKYVRVFVKCILPVGICLSIIILYSLEQNRSQYWIDKFFGVIEHVANKPELSVKLLSVEGASVSLDQEIRNTIPLRLPASSFDIELDNIREAILKLPAINNANIRVVSGGILKIQVEERIPALVWRNQVGLFLLDKEGKMVGSIGSRAERSDLPFIAGEGANSRIFQALKLMELAAPIFTRILALEWVSNYRWDIVLSDSQRILLPPNNPELAIDRFLLLNETYDILARKISRIDMRNESRLVIAAKIETNLINE
ncbi:MAG: cell division protein FtsQ/DivIB [Proteobacteria bacterium]|jgi:cell division protein FtsQ|nr:cell division protein FtsQ/DivIB [Pseudomonadota bacterium]